MKNSYKLKVVSFKLFIQILVVNFAFLIFLNPINAQEIDLITAEQANLDTSIIREDINFNLPSKIVIVPIFSNDSEIDLYSENMYRGIYFYTIDVLGFNDVPYHYLVGEDGEIYQGNTGGEERRVKIDGIGDDMVVIGYMTNKNAGKFSNKSKNSLKDLTLKIANENAVDPKNITVNGAKFIRNQTTRSVSIVQTDIFGTWNTSLSEITDYVKANYKPKGKTYEINAENPTAPTNTVNPGETVTMKIKVNNLGTNGIYGGTDSELVLTKTSENPSAFFLNNEWLSTTQVSVMQSDQILLPLDEGEFEFKVKVPLFIGEVKEEYEFRTINGGAVKANKITLKLNVNSTNKQIVEIQSTETGTLNVRATASSVAQIIEQVSPGQRFFVTDNAGNGWIQIDLGDGTRGWVSQQYLSFLN